MPGLSKRRRRAAPDLPARVAGLRTALDVGGDRLDDAARSRAVAVLDRTDQRLALGPEHTVVALAGATGSGKSSLFNALAGLAVAQVGARRPTTSVPTACIWGEGADELLDWLGVPRRHRTIRSSELDADDEEDLTGLVLIDLPDHDSTEMAHRLEVDRLVGLVDLLVWVVDPQKYADDVLHAQYLRRMVGHEGVMVVVLNQVDTLAPADVESCLADLRRLLLQDGLVDPRVLLTSARTRQGIDGLRGMVAEVVRHREVVVLRATADLEAASSGLADGVGESEADPDKVDGAGLLVEALAGAAGVPVVLEAVQADYRRRATARAGWPFSRWVRRLRPDPMRRLHLGEAGQELRRLERSSLPEPTQSQRARVELATRTVATRSSAGLPQPWVDAVRQAAAPPGPDLADALDQAVVGVDLEHRSPAWWSVLGALQLLFAVAAVVGAVWLVGLGVVAWLQLPDLPAVHVVGRVPLPTLLLVAGLLLGLLLALLARRLAAVGARRRRARVRSAMEAAVEVVARERVLEPVGRVLRDHRATREALGVG